jgi:hypothetical protein
LPGNRINLVYSQRRLAVHPVVAAVDPMCLMGSVTMPCITSAIEGDGADLRSGSALDVRGRKDYISRLTRSERSGPEVRLVGARRLPQREIEASPPWRAINILGVALMNRSNRIDYIRIPTPTPKFAFRFIGGRSAHERGPIIGTVSRPQDRNVIRRHGGSYALYRALAVSSGTLDPIRRPDLTNTYPAAKIGPFPQWMEPRRIVSIPGDTPQCKLGGPSSRRGR